MGDYGQSSPQGGPSEPSRTGYQDSWGLLSSPPSPAGFLRQALTFGFPLQKCLHFLQPALSTSSWYDGDSLQ